MAGFDAEAYLRDLAERTLDAPGPLEYRPSALLAAVQALVAAECIGEREAQCVLDEQETERRRRDPDYPIRWKRRPPRALAAHRVLAPEREVSDELYVRYVALAPDAVRLDVDVKQRLSRTWRRGYPRALYPRDREVTDDQGTTVDAGFSGHGRRGRWSGTLQAPALSLQTQWLEIDGRRLELEGVGRPASVRVETLPSTDAPVRHLRHQASLGHPRLDYAIAALVAAGAVKADHPELDVLRAVASVSERDGRARRGLTATIPLGVATPLFDGVSVVVDAIVSTPEDWSVAVELTPEGASPFPFETPTARSTTVAWWAMDDRGNRYLAEHGGCGGDPERAIGKLTFKAPLDPDARWIELAPQTETMRAMIRVPLMARHRPALRRPASR